MAQLGFHLDLTKCISCRSCEGACKQENDVPFGARWRKVKDVKAGRYPKPVVIHLSIACNHCKDPECMRVCPVNAYSKRKKDGIVEHDKDKCIGCRYCTWACPYGVPQYEVKTKKVHKCEFCKHRIEKGLMPACVQSCLTGALSFGTMDEIIKKNIVVEERVVGFPDPAITTPSIRFKPPRRKIT